MSIFGKTRSATRLMPFACLSVANIKQQAICASYLMCACVRVTPEPYKCRVVVCCLMYVKSRSRLEAALALLFELAVLITLSFSPMLYTHYFYLGKSIKHYHHAGSASICTRYMIVGKTTLLPFTSLEGPPTVSQLRLRSLSISIVRLPLGFAQYQRARTHDDIEHPNSLGRFLA